MEDEEGIIADLKTALREFSRPEDLDSENNKPTVLFERPGWNSTCFRRGDFVPNGRSYIAELLRSYENGNNGALSTIQGIIRFLHDTIEIQTNEAPIDGANSAKRMLTSLVLLCRRNIFEVLDFKKPLQ